MAQYCPPASSCWLWTLATHNLLFYNKSHLNNPIISYIFLFLKIRTKHQHNHLTISLLIIQLPITKTLSKTGQTKQQHNTTFVLWSNTKKDQIWQECFLELNLLEGDVSIRLEVFLIQHLQLLITDALRSACIQVTLNLVFLRLLQWFVPFLFLCIDMLFNNYQF